MRQRSPVVEIAGLGNADGSPDNAPAIGDHRHCEVARMGDPEDPEGILYLSAERIPAGRRASE